MCVNLSIQELLLNLLCVIFYLICKKRKAMQICTAMQMIFEGVEEQDVPDVHERLSSIKFATVAGVVICSVLLTDVEVRDLCDEMVIPSRRRTLPLICCAKVPQTVEPHAWYGVNALHINALSRWLCSRDGTHVFPSVTTRVRDLLCRIERLKSKLSNMDSTIDWSKRGEEDGEVYTSGEWERKMLRGLELQLECIEELGQ